VKKSDKNKWKSRTRTTTSKYILINWVSSKNFKQLKERGEKKNWKNYNNLKKNYCIPSHTYCVKRMKKYRVLQKISYDWKETTKRCSKWGKQRNLSKQKIRRIKLTLTFNTRRKKLKLDNYKIRMNLKQQSSKNLKNYHC
jgi:hypothetical protein